MKSTGTTAVLLGMLTAAVLLLLLLFLLARASASTKTIPDADVGVLVLAHGAGKQWNDAIKEAVQNVRGGHKKAIVLGMGDADSIQSGIDLLQNSGVKAIVVIPLFISSRSEMYRNIEYILGLREEPDILFWILMNLATEEPSKQKHGHGQGRSQSRRESEAAENNGHGGHDTDGMEMNITDQIKFGVPYAVADPINYSPIVSKILEENLRKVVNPQKHQSVLLLAHGPISEDDNHLWLRDLGAYANDLSNAFRGTNFYAFTFRDDAPDFIREKAWQKIKTAIDNEKKKVREVIIIPYLLAPGGRESEIREQLKHCGCIILSNTLLPHPGISLWIEKQIEREKIKF